jgi:hypothetical protein
MKNGEEDVFTFIHKTCKVRDPLSRLYTYVQQLSGETRDNLLSDQQIMSSLYCGLAVSCLFEATEPYKLDVNLSH